MFASINGEIITKGSIVVPLRGCFTADLWTAQALDLTGTVTIILGDLTLIGTITRGGNFTGQSSFRIIGGHGGWMRTIPPKYYQSNIKVMASVVLADAAKEVGETVSVSTDRNLGQKYVREQGPAARVLNSLAEQWYIRADGVTVVGARPTPTIVSAFDVVSYDPEKGKVVVATDNPAAWLPGAKFSSPTLSTKNINFINHKITPTTLRTEVWTSG